MCRSFRSQSPIADWPTKSAECSTTLKRQGGHNRPARLRNKHAKTALSWSCRHLLLIQPQSITLIVNNWPALMLWKSQPIASKPRPVRSRSLDFSVSQVLVLFVALILLISIPIWTHPLPPLSDYVNHLARMQVIAELSRDHPIAKFYELHWQVIPNLAMDIVVPPLARIMNVYLAGQVFLVLMFVVIISGILVLNRALVGRFSVLPLFAIP